MIERDEAGNETAIYYDRLSFPYTGSREGRLTVDESGTGYISLKGGESIVLDGIPHGASYKVEEVEADDYEVSSVRNGTEQGGASWEGTVVGDASVELAYTNARYLGTGALSISKQVTGQTTERPFRFTVRFFDAEGAELAGQRFAYTGSAEGSIKSGDGVWLAHGESIRFDGLPAGTRYEVAEDEVEGYTSASEGAEGSIGEGSLSEARFTNTAEKEEPESTPTPTPKKPTPSCTPETADPTAPASGAFALGLAAAAAALRLRRRAEAVDA